MTMRTTGGRSQDQRRPSVSGPTMSDTSIRSPEAFAVFDSGSSRELSHRA
jgi:hypothetical protein